MHKKFVIHLMHRKIREPMHNGHYGCFMMTIIKDLLTFIDNGHYGCFMMTIMKDFSAFLDTCIKSL